MNMRSWALMTGAFGLAIAFAAFAQTVDPVLVGERKAALERDLAAYEAQIDQYRATIEGKRTESASFERDIAILNAEIKKAQLAIKARTIAIEQLADTIGEKSDYVGELRVKLERELKSLTERRVILESDIAKLTTPGGVEEEIRKKFPVVQAGERVIVVVPEELGSTSAASSTGGWPQWLAGLIKWR